MGMLPLAAIGFWWTLFATVWALLALGLILIVLIQKGRGGGIGAAFGGGGANSLLGTKTGDFLTWVTICLVSLFLVGAVVMGKYMRPHSSSGLAPAGTPMQQLPVFPETDTAGAADQAEAVEAVDAAVEQAADSVALPVEQD